LISELLSNPQGSGAGFVAADFGLSFVCPGAAAGTVVKAANDNKRHLSSQADRIVRQRVLRNSLKVIARFFRDPGN
jgi:hypothetical protein